jgi:hypothetical protein
MPSSEKDRAAHVALERWIDLQVALSDKRKYPIECFNAFVGATRHYIELTKRDPLIPRSVATAINGLSDFLASERKRVPGNVLHEAERLECRFSVAMIRVSTVMSPLASESLLKRSGTFEGTWLRVCKTVNRPRRGAMPPIHSER